jgi:hypothetical protein
MQSPLLAKSEKTIEPLAKIRRVGDEAFEVEQLRGVGYVESVLRRNRKTANIHANSGAWILERGATGL